MRWKLMGRLSWRQRFAALFGGYVTIAVSTVESGTLTAADIKVTTEEFGQAPYTELTIADLTKFTIGYDPAQPNRDYTVVKGCRLDPLRCSMYKDGFNTPRQCSLRRGHRGDCNFSLTMPVFTPTPEEPWHRCPSTKENGLRCLLQKGHDTDHQFMPDSVLEQVEPDTTFRKPSPCIRGISNICGKRPVNGNPLTPDGPCIREKGHPGHCNHVAIRVQSLAEAMQNPDVSRMIETARQIGCYDEPHSHG